jgi:type VI secretion system secreted protein VgrG
MQSKENIKIALAGVSTNSVDVGQSVVQHKIESFHERPLTSGEIAMARQMFGNSIDYSKVKVHNHGYLPFDLQGENTAMSPDGEIYFRKENYEADFSR